MRVFALLCVLLLAAPAMAQVPRESVLTVFDSVPTGATVEEMRGEHRYIRGVTGTPMYLPVPRDPHAILHFTVRMDGYADVSPIEVQAQDLLDSADRPVHVPQEGPVHLVPLNALVPIRTFLVQNARILGGLAALAGVGLLALLPRQRRLLARTRQLQALVATDESDDVNVGKRFGKWLIVRLLGRGGCASVYEAVPWETLEAREHVALKIMHPEAATGEFRERFKREVRICKSLNHPNVVRLLDWDLGPILYLTMEIVEGQSLRRLIPRSGFPLQDAVQILGPAFAAVGYAHQQGIVHNDLKPDNIMITPDGKVRVMDFGIATGSAYPRLTRTSDVLGTPGYLAPEQMDGARSEPRSDQYAMGVIAFEVLTGRTLFEEADPVLRIAQHCSKKPPQASDVNPQVPAAVSEVVDCMLKKRPEERYPSMEAAWEALRGAAGVAVP